MLRDAAPGCCKELSERGCAHFASRGEQRRATNGLGHPFYAYPQGSPRLTWITPKVRSSANHMKYDAPKRTFRYRPSQRKRQMACNSRTLSAYSRAAGFQSMSALHGSLSGIGFGQLLALILVTPGFAHFQNHC